MLHIKLVTGTLYLLHMQNAHGMKRSLERLVHGEAGATSPCANNQTVRRNRPKRASPPRESGRKRKHSEEPTTNPKAKRTKTSSRQNPPKYWTWCKCGFLPFLESEATVWFKKDEKHHYGKIVGGSKDDWTVQLFEFKDLDGPTQGIPTPTDKIHSVKDAQLERTCGCLFPEPGRRGEKFQFFKPNSRRPNPEKREHDGYHDLIQDLFRDDMVMQWDQDNTTCKSSEARWKWMNAYWEQDDYRYELDGAQHVVKTNYQGDPAPLVHLPEDVERLGPNPGSDSQPSSPSDRMDVDS